MSSRLRRWRPALTAAVLVALGQLVLVALGPLTRAPRAHGGASGIWNLALLSSDSRYYLRASHAETLLTDVPLTRIAFPAILRLGDVLGSPETFAVVVNLIALLLAGTALYDLGARFGGTSRAGTLAAGALVVNPLTAQWARFVLTETLSYAAVVGLLWGVIRFVEHPTRRTLLLVAATGVFIALLRPNGVLVFAGALSAVLHLTHRRWLTQRGSQWLLHVFIWCTAVAFFLLGSQEADLGSESTSELIVSLYYAGVVVEGTPEVLVTVAMPQASDPLDRSLNAAGRYAMEHPFAVTRLVLLRIGYETLQVRPHYPSVVNLAMALGFGFFLLFALRGARGTRSRRLTLTMLAIALPQVLLVGATFAVPESRYGWTYLVTLCVWVGIGADETLRRCGETRTKVLERIRFGSST